MKKLNFGCLLLICLVFGSCNNSNTKQPKQLPPSVSKAPKVQVNITAEAYSELYINTINSYGTMPEYHVRVKMVNGNQLLKYDKVVAVFIPAKGQPLIFSTAKYTEGRDQIPGSSEDIKLFVMKPHETEEFNFQTNGYTMDLLSDAGDYPLQFSFTVMKKGEILAGPYQANLPLLSDLPSYERSISSGKKLEATKLKFF